MEGGGRGVGHEELAGKQIKSERKISLYWKIWDIVTSPENESSCLCQKNQED